MSMFGFLKKVLWNDGWYCCSWCSPSVLIGANHLLFTSDPLLGCPPVAQVSSTNQRQPHTTQKTCMISRNKWAKLLILTIRLSYYFSTTFLYYLLTVSSKGPKEVVHTGQERQKSSKIFLDRLFIHRTKL